LITAVRVVARGEALLSPSVTRRVIQEVIRQQRRVSRSADVGRLTQRELEVLGLVAEGLTNAEIAARLYLTEATVKTHTSNVLSKLGLRDRVQAVIFAYEHGLVDR
jgi:DNA-binding NarL/FixJ family response regulator